MLQRPTELVRTGGPLRSASDAIQSGDHVVDLLSPHKLADALQITITTTQEEYLLDDIVLIGCYIDQL